VRKTTLFWHKITATHLTRIFPQVLKIQEYLEKQDKGKEVEFIFLREINFKGKRDNYEVFKNSLEL